MIIILISLWIVVSTFIITVKHLAMANGYGSAARLSFFNFFTNDSNILSALSAYVVMMFSIDALVRNRKVPRWAASFHLMGVTSVGLTMLTCLVFLAPLSVVRGGSYLDTFRGDQLLLHLINPSLSIISFLLISPAEKLSLRSSLLGLIPTAVYGGVYCWKVLFEKSWVDFYFFTFGGHNELAPIVFVIMLLVTWLIAFVLAAIHRSFFIEEETWDEDRLHRLLS